MEEHMKRMLTTIAAGSLLATLALAQPPRYKLTDLGPVGLPPGEPHFIANTGLVAGAAPMPDGTMHAVLWYGGHKLDIGANRLGGPNSQAFSVNDRGQVVGEAQTSVPNSEDFCGFNAMGLPSSATACRPFVWQNGMIAELPNTLGGANAVANLINNRGAVAGLAETNQHEPGCPVGQFSPVIWQNGKLQSLPTYAGDPDGGRSGINGKGQSVGASGSCAPFNPNSQLYLFESHALLWDSDGSVHDLGNFGGTGAFAGNHGCAINNQGQVVGHSDVTGDACGHPVKGQPDGFLGLEHEGRPPGLCGADRDEERDGHLLGVLQAGAETDNCLASHCCLLSSRGPTGRPALIALRSELARPVVLKSKVRPVVLSCQDDERHRET